MSSTVSYTGTPAAVDGVTTHSFSAAAQRHVVNLLGKVAGAGAATEAAQAAELARMNAAVVDPRKRGQKRDAPPTNDDLPPEKAPMPMTDDEIRERVARFVENPSTIPWDTLNYGADTAVGRIMDSPRISLSRKSMVIQIVAAAFAAAKDAKRAAESEFA